MFDHILLDPEQVDLLHLVVEGSRNLPREQRRKFIVSRTTGGDFMIHPGLSGNDRQTYMGDIEVLAGAGLLNLGYGSGGSPIFDVTPLGFRYYEHLHSGEREPIRAVEHLPIEYLEAASFQTQYPLAYSKWREAERLLWTADSLNQLTAVGHHCREAMQAFATSLVHVVNPPSVDQDPAHVVARVRAVIEHRRRALGEATSEVLEALLAYWGTVSDLVQRQEHGAQKEGQQLVWLDARRVVFQAATVMYEIDATFSVRR
jgi:hypothetical protein